MEINSSMIKVIVTTVTIGLVGTSIVYIISKLRSKKLTKPFIPVGVVKKLLIYPIKSLKPIECDQVIVKPNEGLYCNQLRDRSFLLVNCKNIFITQRAQPKLVLLDLQLIDNNETIKVTSPDGDSITIPLTIDKNTINNLEIVETKVWDDKVEGIDCGPEISKFFSNYLGKLNVRLLRFDKDLIDHRPAQVYSNYKITKDPTIKIMYQDQAPVLIINDKSVETLNQLLTEGSISYLNFRPNILIEAQSFDEDNWEKLIIGKTKWQQLKKCTRCVMTTINIDDGTFMKEPMITLKKYRNPMGEDSGYHSPLMGIHVNPEKNGTIKIGDSVLASHKL
ncbi:mitochondrial amidoxime reducing component 2-like [Panonychus citri]|uniref:mitochondrial amidoxime reducing component 2-like n=1 Tax=Panonychus citri TaxID=50023 RepID=UPI002308266F|nr:mitochondrial amidoxime reducing component 2-like [Panonychus citri]